MRMLQDPGSPHISFQYNGEDAAGLMHTAAVHTTALGDNKREVSLLFPDGLEIVRTITEYPDFDACEWVTRLINHSGSRSGLISDLCDCDAFFDLGEDDPPKPGFAVSENMVKINGARGSDFSREDFRPWEEWLLPGQTKCYAPVGGRSSDGTFPFFDVSRGGSGMICAVGWTGQWRAVFSREPQKIRIRTGLEETSFRLLPGESFRTSSVVLMEYGKNEGSAADDRHADGRNRFRRLVKEHFSLIGSPGRPENGPLCTMSWGAVPSDKMIGRIRTIAAADLGFDTYWIDAAWYGAPEGRSPSEWEGDWSTQTGNWEVNRKVHPDGLVDVAHAACDAGLGFLLWIEPERVISDNPLPKEHPNWFFKLPDDAGDGEVHHAWLLNLGNCDAFDGTLALISGYIEKLGLTCYRQDFNIDPLRYWRANDAPERRGISEILHINGLYRLWDNLLDRFPGLIIDNCSSGGRRIDIETLRRSIPLWRSDYQCTWDYDAEASQMQNTGISRWIPYSGTGTGCVTGDLYHFRSAYSSAMTTNYWGYEAWDIDPACLDWVRKSNDEYLRVRPYFSCDFYDLTPWSSDDGGWTIWQYDRPERGDGILMAFRRPKSPLVTAVIRPRGLTPDRMIRLEDADTAKVFEISSTSLIGRGLNISLPTPRSSILYYYAVLPAGM